MRRVPWARSATIPASFSRRRWRETAGRLMGIAAAISWTGLSPPLSRRRISRRFGSPKASKGSPEAGARTIRSAARLDSPLEPLGELVEGRAQVGHRPPDQRQKRAGVLFAHVKRGAATRVPGQVEQYRGPLLALIWRSMPDL